MASYDQCFWANSGYETIRKHNKMNLEFLKEFYQLVQERGDLEKDFSNKLMKLTQRGNKSNHLCLGTIQSAWSKFTGNLESESEIHSKLAASLDTLSKNLAEFHQMQVKDRKALESQFEKHNRNYSDRQSKFKLAQKNQFSKLRELEQYQVALSEARENRIKSTEKDIVKLEGKTKRAEEVGERVSVLFSSTAKSLEDARLGWEGAIYKYARDSQLMEQERINTLSDSLRQYIGMLDMTAPKLQTVCQELSEVVTRISPQSDIQSTCNRVGMGEYLPEQCLYYGYENMEDTALKPETRRLMLERRLTEFEEAILATQKGKVGVQQLSSAYEQTPNFSTATGQDDVRRQLLEMDTLTNFLKASHFIIEKSLLTLTSQSPSNSHLEPYIQIASEGKGLPQSKLKVPIQDVTNIADEQHSSIYQTIPGAVQKVDPSYGKNNLLSAIESFPDESEYGATGYQGPSTEVCDTTSNETLGQCIAQYDYAAQAFDELTIAPGDVISIIEQDDPGWWKGKLNNRIGVFPATYVTQTDA
ncbi:Nostrin-like [Oopsacas minuta]|uniref:Nostrin-like n=1 Tax=Oopsacas minuta TaxID=111878 RepID=A0AAV7JEP0_9METZ|nr:Nostrin-like [Oopsacas minuta]